MGKGGLVPAWLGRDTERRRLCARVGLPRISTACLLGGECAVRGNKRSEEVPGGVYAYVTPLQCFSGLR